MAGTLKLLFDGPGSGVRNMERDAALLATHRRSDDPILRIYRWDPPAVSMGYNQNEAQFDAGKVAEAGFHLVRRPTGGRAILHADELTYAVVGSSPGPLFGSSLHDTYQRINQALMTFLEDLGIQADVSDGESRAEARGLVCFKSAGRHEISVDGQKFIGSAQRRTGDVFLQHGSILAGNRHLELERFLNRGGTGKPSDELAAGTTDLGRLLGRPLSGDDLDGLGRQLAAAFSRAWNLDLQEISEIQG